MDNLENFQIPLDVPNEIRGMYLENYYSMTRGTGKLMVFAGDQKAEHFNDDFCGESIPKEDNDPEHLFKIASKADIGIFATQMGLINQYGMDYPDVPYMVKINSKTNLVSKENDPVSIPLTTIEEVVRIRDTQLPSIMAVGYTIYSGSRFESNMFQEAAKVVRKAHQHGLVAMIWSYPRGKGVQNEKDPHVIAGAAGMAAVLGSDFVKVNFPKSANSIKDLNEAVIAAGRTKLVTAGGSSQPPKNFLQQNHDILHKSKAFGSATGRNIHQKTLKDAVNMANAIAAITYDNVTATKAYKIYNSN